MSRSTDLDVLDLLNSATKVIESSEDYKDYQEYLQENLQANLNRFYSSQSLIYTTDELLPGATHCLGQKGIWSLLQDDNLLNDCVVATMISANHYNANSERVKAVWKSGDMQETVDRMNASIHKILGFNNFVLDKRRDTAFHPFIRIG